MNTAIRTLNQHFSEEYVEGLFDERLQTACCSRDIFPELTKYPQHPLTEDSVAELFGDSRVEAGHVGINITEGIPAL
jgi:hypothetical protein